MFFHPCRDVRQAAWDPCSYRWIIWSKWEIELCVISVEMVGEAMCLYNGTQWCSVCGEEEGSKNRALGNPSDQFMCFGYLPSPGHPERPTSEIGFKPAKWNPVTLKFYVYGHMTLIKHIDREFPRSKDKIIFCVTTLTKWELKWCALFTKISLILHIQKLAHSAVI